MIMSNKEVITALPKEKILDYVNIEGVDYPRVDWNTIENTFPEKDIVYTDSAIVEDDRCFICTLLTVCDLDDGDIVIADWFNKGQPVEALRNVSPNFVSAMF